MAGKNSSKINWKGVILFLLFALIGWKLYKPKLATLPKTLREQGFIHMEIKGDEYILNNVGSARLRFTRVEGNAWFGTTRKLGDKIYKGLSTIQIPYPLELWIKESSPKPIIEYTVPKPYRPRD